MTDIEAKALALINAEIDYDPTANDAHEYKALCRAIEQHEAFKQEVSKAMTYIKALYPTLPTDYDRFIAKPDPLVEVLADTFGASLVNVEDFRAALEARGLEIREKGE